MKKVVNAPESHKDENYSDIFTSYQIKSYRLKNRIVAIPIYTAYAHPDGSVSALLIDHYKHLAGSGVSMVVVANAAVSPDGVVSRYTLRADRDEFIKGLTVLADTILKQGAVACLQLNHAGRFAKTDRPLLPAPIQSANLTFNIASLKNFMNFFPLEARFRLTRYFLKMASTWRHPMTSQDRERVIEQFGAAAVRGCRAGFDMIELHGANGYLLCQFLSSFTNRRASGESLSFQDRASFPIAVIREIKQRLPEDYPIGFRLILREWVPGGVNLNDAIEWAKILNREDIAYLSVAAGTYNSIFSSSAMKTMSRPGYLRNDVNVLSKSVTTPTIISGRILKPDIAHKLIQEGTADLIGLGRPLRADSRWVDKAKGGKGRLKVCIDCNWCLKRVVLDQGFSCKRWPKLQQERIDLKHQLLTRNYRALWVVTDMDEVAQFKKSFPMFLPDPKNMSTPINPTLLLLFNKHSGVIGQRVQHTLVPWGRMVLDRCGFVGGTFSAKSAKIKESPEEAVINEIDKGNHGVILLYRNRNDPWRERLLYKIRNKVVGLIDTNEYLSKVLVPVDLSTTTLLLLMFFRQTYVGKKGVDIRFVHVLTGPVGHTRHRWHELTKLVDFERPPLLELIRSKGDVAQDLIEMIHKDQYGTIIMGKRGLSRIKRWWLGSVSAGVLRGLSHQSLFLID